MSRNLNVPISIRIKEHTYVNLSLATSWAVQPGLAQKELKKGGDANKPDDYLMVTADTITFYYAYDRGVSFRVGIEISREDYERVSALLKRFEYCERKRTSKKDAEGAE